ncbi:MAG: hypothetical protein RDV48_19740 [Candidatus Eremiobacteraeota bacterium]|nr:hypothetical protein [Candidatus Eremiobacteraeota bacterium]
MFDIFFTYFFPSLLIAGTLLLGYKEVRNHLHLKAQDRIPPWANKRLTRRVVGLAIMLVIGIMIFVGVSFLQSSKLSVYYWLVCLFLVVCVLVLALWDAICEIRIIKEYVDDFHNTELQNLKNKFKIYHN